MPSNTLSRGNTLYDFVIAPTLTPTSLTASGTAEQTFTVVGLQTSDIVAVNSTTAQTVGIGIVNVRVSAPNALSIQFSNSSVTFATPVAGLYNINIVRPENLPLPTNAA